MTEGNSPIIPSRGATTERPILVPKTAGVSKQHATAGLMLLGHLSSLPAVASLAADCASLGEHAPGQSDFFASTLEICGEVSKGNLKPLETILMNQALSLNVLSNTMMNRATRNIGINYDRAESYMRLALKAQNQSRMTLETLANVKNPPVVYARQANINNGGQQQVNNGAIPNPHCAHGSNPGSERNEVLEAGDGAWVEPGTTGQAGRSNSTVAEAVKLVVA